MDWVTEQFFWLIAVTTMSVSVAALAVWQMPCRSQQEGDKAAAVAMLTLVPIAATSIVGCIAEQLWFLPVSLGAVVLWHLMEGLLHPSRALEFAPAEPLLGCALLVGIGQSVVLATFSQWYLLLTYLLLLPAWVFLQWQSRRRPEALRFANTLVYDNSEANELLAFSALHASLNHWSHDRLDGQVTPVKSWRKTARSTLAQQWGITAAEELHEPLRNYLRPQVVSGEKVRTLSPELMAQDTLERVSMMFVCRLAFASGWIDEVTAWTWMRRIAIPLRGYYQSWDGVAEAIACALESRGRAPRGTKKQQLNKVFLRLRHADSSPWVRLEWPVSEQCFENEAAKGTSIKCNGPSLCSVGELRASA